MKTFIDQRAQESQIKDRLHALRYVTNAAHENLTDTPTPRLHIQIPHVGGRLIETGDEEFLKLPFDDCVLSSARHFFLFGFT